MSTVRIANAPVSYGAFELTVGSRAFVPEPDEVLAAMAAAGYEGTELGARGYFGEGDSLRSRLEHHGLSLVGAWCELRFSEPHYWEHDLQRLDETLALLASVGATGARPVFGDAGSDTRRARPGGGQYDPSLSLDHRGWRDFAEGLARAADRARERGFEPVFHPHLGTHVESTNEVERLLAVSDIALVVDPGHFVAGGIDPVRAVSEWAPRVAYVHLKDVRLDVFEHAMAATDDLLAAWRRGIFCELGQGSVDLGGVLDALERIDYAGWICVEQDTIAGDRAAFLEAVVSQTRNRAWLRARGL